MVRLMLACERKVKAVLSDASGMNYVGAEAEGEPT
jgi:hypothetical protein